MDTVMDEYLSGMPIFQQKKRAEALYNNLLITIVTTLIVI